MKTSSILGAAPTLLALVLILAGTACSDARGDFAEATIVGGEPAPEASLDAVGSIIERSAGEDRPFCTATLIAADLVLTAKHCALRRPDRSDTLIPGRDLVFRIGATAARGRTTATFRTVSVSSVVDVGVSEWGSDVAIYRLAQPIPDVAPLVVADRPLDATDVGHSFLAVGFGFSDLNRSSIGERRKTTLDLIAVTGKPFAHEYGSRAAFYAKNIGDDVPQDIRRELEVQLSRKYDRELLVGYEAYVRAGATAAGSCTAGGDSGGPLLERRGDHLIVRAVVSMGVGGSKTECRGTIYATFGPAVQQLVRTMRDGAD